MSSSQKLSQTSTSTGVKVVTAKKTAKFDDDSSDDDIVMDDAAFNLNMSHYDDEDYM